MKQSAGILLFRHAAKGVEVLLVHPGGPYWAKKDLAAWSIPKGECDPDEDILAAAVREFQEETGQAPPTSDLLPLGEVRQPNGNKNVTIWAAEGDLDVNDIRSEDMTMEWPPKSGQQLTFPEVDKGAWVTLDIAVRKLVKGQVPFIARLAEQLDVSLDEAHPIAVTAEPVDQTSLF